MNSIERITQFSEDRQYRYTLWREWPPLPAEIYRRDYMPGSHCQFCMFICLNPSTADETRDDPTIRKCIGFAKRWGFGALVVTNLFAYRATDPRVMMSQNKPVGRDNNRWIVACARDAGMIVMAWGTKGAFMARDEEVFNLVAGCCCLRETKSGFPEHPLYVPYDTKPVSFPILPSVLDERLAMPPAQRR